MTNVWFSRFLCALVLAVSAAGCAAVHSKAAGPAAVNPPEAGQFPAASAGEGWWYLRFRMQWPEGQPPAWETDLLIADGVVRPVLERHTAEIPLWRFHRRAARDAAGHQFSFIFYASPETARAVFAETEGTPALQLARASGRVIAVVADDPAGPLRTGIGDTSDAAWSPALRDAWPHYLMGASRMWLDLVSRLVPKPAGSGFGELEAAYTHADAAVTAVWREEGRHALLHHLNALFGYEPLEMRF